MKSLFNITNISAIALAALLAACSSKPENKADQLAVLKKDQADLNNKIEALEKEIAKEHPENATKLKMKDVSVTELEPRPFDHYIQTQGSVVAIDNIQMSAKAAGNVTNVFAREGEAV